jgi:hypothetical protein
MLAKDNTDILSPTFIDLKQLMLEPSLNAARTLVELPIFMNESTLIVDPKRPNDLTLNVDPILTISKTDTFMTDPIMV